MHEINFEKDENNHLIVTIYTERLQMESVSPLHLDNYLNLFSTAENMVYFGTGNALTPDKIKFRLNPWIDRWNKNDPFSALAIFNRDTDEFLGNIVLGYGDREGSAELAYALNKKHWHQGYGTESVTTIVSEYATELVKRNYKIGKHPFTSITAGCHPENKWSIRILEKSGLKRVSEKVLFGRNQYTFFMETTELLQKEAEKPKDFSSTAIEFISKQKN